MAERRSLSTAVNSADTAFTVDPQLVRSFVTHSQPMTVKVGSATSSPSAATIDSTKDRDESGSRSNAIVGKAREARKSKRLNPVGLIPVTIRLTPEIAGALKRASLELELAGEEVFTQQEIVESSLRPWLRDNGFLD